MCVAYTDYLYPQIKLLVVELNPFALMVFIAERHFVRIPHSAPNIPPLLIWSIWHGRKLFIILYMMNTCIHLYFHPLYDVHGVESVERIVGRLVYHYNNVCVLMPA